MAVDLAIGLTEGALKPSEVVIITFYQGQAGLIRRLMAKVGGAGGCGWWWWW